MTENNLSDHEKKVFDELTASLRSEGFAKKLSLGSPRFALLAGITIVALIGTIVTFTFSTIAALCCLAVAFTSAVIATRRWSARRPHPRESVQSAAQHPSGPTRR
jgi:hypothetical protein